MIGMTNAMGGKDRLRYRVFGGTTPPASPMEYDFYVKTTTPIISFELNSWVNTLPTWFPGNGFVYIVTGAWTTDAINLVKDGNGILLPFLPKWCWQQINGQWYQMEAYVYKSGSWVKFSDYKYTPPWDGTLFYNGDQYTDHTGGFGGVTSVDTVMKVVAEAGSYDGKAWFACSNSPVNLSGWSKLCIDGNANCFNSSGHYSGHFGVFRENIAGAHNSDWIDYGGWAPVASTSMAISRETTVLDISAINESLYIAWGMMHGSLWSDVYKIWLEK